MGAERLRHFPRPLGWALGLCVVLALSGCPYASEHPLSDPAAASIDPNLVGTWKWQDPETHEWVSLSFFPFNNSELVAITPGDNGKAADAYRVFVTSIDTEGFLNVQQLGEKQGGLWNFVHYRIEGDRLVLRLLDDTLFGSTSFSSAEALRDFVRCNLGDPRLYGTDEGPTEMKWQREVTEKRAET